MRCIYKKRILDYNSGETMVEVIVAFTLLSIMMVIFTQGITWASKSEMNASKRREAADEAMLQVQRLIVNDRKRAIIDRRPSFVGWSFSDRLFYKKYECQINGTTYTYVVYEAITE